MESKYSFYRLTGLSDELIAAIEKDLPAFSGSGKHLKVIIELAYGDDHQYVAIIFTRPQRFVVVGYNHAARQEDLCDQYRITSCDFRELREEGLSFFCRILPRPHSWQIITSEIVSGEIVEFGSVAFLEV